MDTPDQTGASAPTTRTAARGAWTATRRRHPSGRCPRSTAGFSTRPRPSWSRACSPGRQYVGPRLTISRALDFAETLDILRDVADELGWDVDPEGEDPRGGPAIRSPAGLAQRRLRRVTLAPDGWILLQQARASTASNGCAGSGSTTWSSRRARSGRTRSTRRTRSTPPTRSMRRTPPRPSGSAISTYAVPGWGGRQPVAYVGAPPDRRRRSPVGARSSRSSTPAAAGTPCARPSGHQGRDPRRPADRVRRPDHRSGAPRRPAGPAGRVIDPFSGHGTFIAGLVHQACPDADLVVWRAVRTDRSSSPT